LAAGAADNGAPELAAGIARMKSAKTPRHPHWQLAVAAASARVAKCARYVDYIYAGQL
jgi:hypothetical protein